MKYKTADEWCDSAMQRDSMIDESQQELREKHARDFVLQQGLAHDEGLWQDYQLYIQGKMELEEYQDYLLFKHSKK
ncbi:MAG: hypothetical protein R8K49_08655 [Mariprofundaceae bacterium]